MRSLIKVLSFILIAIAIPATGQVFSQITLDFDDSRVPAARLPQRQQQRATQLRAVIEHALPGDTITLGKGTYDFSPNQLRLPPYVKIRGAGMNATTLATNWVGTAALGCCFECGNQTTLEDLTLASTCGIGEQNEVFGFGGAPTPGGDLTVSNSTINLTRVAATGHAWVLYAWSGANNTINATDCSFHGGRWVVANCRSASGLENTFNLTRCTITCDSSLSTHTGLQGARCAGVVARGGKTFLETCLINVQGDSTIDLAGGIWIDRLDADGGGAHPQTSIDVRRTTVRVTANGAKEVFDLGMQIGTITIDKTSTGSNSDGGFTYQGAP